MGLNTRRRNLFTFSRLILLMIAALLVTHTAQAADAITGCIQDIGSFFQLDLRTGKVSLIRPDTKTPPAPTIKTEQGKDGSWQLVIGGTRKGVISLRTQPGDIVERVQLLPESSPLYISVMIQHGNSSLRFEVYSFASLRRLASVDDLLSLCPACIAWNIDKRRVAITGNTVSDAVLRLWLFALDTGVTREFDLYALGLSPIAARDYNPNGPLWSPDGRYIAYVSETTEKFQAISLFGMDGSTYPQIDSLARETYGGEGYIYPVVTWAGDSKRFFYIRFLSAPDAPCTKQWNCNAFLTVYTLDKRQSVQFAQLAVSRYDFLLNKAGTRVMLPWTNGTVNQIGVVDVLTGEKTGLTRTFAGVGAPTIHWQDRGFTWIEDGTEEGYRIIWMGNETAPRKSVTFPGEIQYWGEPIYGETPSYPGPIWNNSAMVVRTQTGNEVNSYSIWLVDLKTAEKRLLARERFRVRADLSPDQQTIILLPDHYGGTQDGEGILKLIPRDKSKPEVELRMNPAPHEVAWSPDSRYLAYTHFTDELTIINTQGKQLRQYEFTYNVAAFEWVKTCLPGEPLN
jgi:hypothetical protein